MKSQLGWAVQFRHSHARHLDAMKRQDLQDLREIGKVLSSSPTDSHLVKSRAEEIARNVRLSGLSSVAGNQAAVATGHAKRIGDHANEVRVGHRIRRR